MVDQPRQELQQVVLVDDHLVVFCAKLPGDEPGMLELVVAFVPGVADAEGLHRAIHLFGHQRHVGAGVDATAEKDAKRHVADHAQSDRLAQFVEQRLLEALG